MPHRNKSNYFIRRFQNMARFTLPRDLYHGKDALDALKTLRGKKAIVVVGGGSPWPLYFNFF